MIITQPSLDEVLLPTDVSATRVKLRSRRTPVKGPRHYENLSTITARWLKDGLVEKKIAQLIVVVGGRADLQFGNYVLRGGGGIFFFVPPGVPHPGGGNRPHLSASAQHEGRSCDLMHFCIWGRAIRCWLCHSHGTEHRHNNDENYFVLHTRARQTFDLLSDEATERREGYSVTCHNLLRVFLTIIEREFSAGRYVHPGLMTVPEEAAAGEDLSDPIERVQHHVRSHLSEPLSIGHAARHAYMSRALFTRRFRQKTGLSFNEFVTERRLQEAKMMLTESEWSIALIARYVGFKSPEHFCRLFGRHVGMAPTQFRQLAREHNPTRVRQ